MFPSVIWSVIFGSNPRIACTAGFHRSVAMAILRCRTASAVRAAGQSLGSHDSCAGGMGPRANQFLEGPLIISFSDSLLSCGWLVEHIDAHLDFLGFVFCIFSNLCFLFVNFHIFCVVGAFVLLGTFRRFFDWPVGPACVASPSMCNG